MENFERNPPYKASNRPLDAALAVEMGRMAKAIHDVQHHLGGILDQTSLSSEAIEDLQALDGLAQTLEQLEVFFAALSKGNDNLTTHQDALNGVSLPSLVGRLTGQSDTHGGAGEAELF